MEPEVAVTDRGGDGAAIPGEVEEAAERWLLLECNAEDREGVRFERLIGAEAEAHHAAIGEQVGAGIVGKFAAGPESRRAILDRHVLVGHRLRVPASRRGVERGIERRVEQQRVLRECGPGRESGNAQHPHELNCIIGIGMQAMRLAWITAMALVLPAQDLEAPPGRTGRRVVIRTEQGPGTGIAWNLDATETSPSCGYLSVLYIPSSGLFTWECGQLAHETLAKGGNPRAPRPGEFVRGLTVLEARDRMLVLYPPSPYWLLLRQTQDRAANSAEAESRSLQAAAALGSASGVSRYSQAPFQGLDRAFWLGPLEAGPSTPITIAGFERGAREWTVLLACKYKLRVKLDDKLQHMWHERAD